MRVVTQLAVLAVLGAVGAGAWTYRDEVASLWAGAPAAGGAQAAGPGRGGPPGGRAVNVEVAEVRVGPVREIVEAVGTVLANESVTVTSRTTGVVREVHFADGQQVQAGQILVQLDDREALAQLEQARATRETARQNLSRTRQLAAQRAAPQARVDELEQTLRAAEAQVAAVEARLQDLSIKAPFAGRVGIRRVSVGALIQPGAQITTLDDVSVVKLRFAVPETAIGALGQGDAVEGVSSAFPDRRFRGSVTAVDTRVDPVTRAVELRADIPNGDGALRPGMFMTVELVVANRPQALLVPEEALVPEGTRQFVYVVADGRAVRTEVRLGTRVPGEAEVVQGLSPGQVVVTAGVQRLRDGAQVRVVEGRTS
jgi:membrane fusion protein (multidrug efflux system)